MSNQQSEQRPVKKPTSRGSHMLQKRRAETALINILSTVIFDDDKCHHYARQLVDNEITTKDDLSTVCTNKPERLVELGITETDSILLVTAFRSDKFLIKQKVQKLQPTTSTKEVQTEIQMNETAIPSTKVESSTNTPNNVVDSIESQSNIKNKEESTNQTQEELSSRRDTRATTTFNYPTSYDQRPSERAGSAFVTFTDAHDDMPEFRFSNPMLKTTKLSENDMTMESICENDADDIFLKLPNGKEDYSRVGLFEIDEPISQTKLLNQQIQQDNNAAFVFVKPHANLSPSCRNLVRDVLKSYKIKIIEEGEITSDEIDRGQLIDQHYYAIGSKAVLLQPSELDVPNSKFESVFKVSWQSVLESKSVFNAKDACNVLSITPAQLDEVWGVAKELGKLVKLGGGFYCGLIDTIPDKPAIYVINGFYMSMRSKFVNPGSSIYYFSVEWNSSDLSFSDFRNKVLGSTDPHFAPTDSIRGLILSNWQSLGLESPPNTGDNGVHASASPFEGLAERMNWLRISPEDDSFGRKLLDSGIPMSLISLSLLNPQIDIQSKDLFDIFENLDSIDCIHRALSLFQAYSKELDELLKEEKEKQKVSKVNESKSSPVEVQRISAKSIRPFTQQRNESGNFLNNPEIDYGTLEDGSQITRRRTMTEAEVHRRKSSAAAIVDTLLDFSTLPMTAYLPIILSDAIFCGHLMTDLDSIAGALGAAELYGGIAARASDINSETQFALNFWGLPAPLPIEILVECQPKAGICLVDHQQMSQVNKAIDPDRIVGVIDHHALQNATIVTDRAIYMDIRPWGSMSTIIAHTFLTIRRKPRKCIAGILLCAILSDTLNLMGPTTTEWDKMMVSVLCEITGITDIEGLAKAQFKAKSKELENLTAEQLCNGDMKVFTYQTDKFRGGVGFAVIETTDDGVILARKDELMNALLTSKQENSLPLLYLAVVNIVSLKSILIVIGKDEESLAQVAFPPNNETGVGPTDDPVLYNLGGLVSRKKDFIPAISRAINKNGWGF